MLATLTQTFIVTFWKKNARIPKQSAAVVILNGKNLTQRFLGCRNADSGTHPVCQNISGSPEKPISFETGRQRSIVGLTPCGIPGDVSKLLDLRIFPKRRRRRR